MLMPAQRASVPTRASRTMPNTGPEGIIVHAMGEFVRGRPAWDFLRDGPRLHAHAYVTPSGVVVQQTGVDWQAPHAYGYNDTLGVEILVPGNFDNVQDLWTAIARPGWVAERQYWATVELLRAWVKRFDFDLLQVRGHWEVDPDKQDPGTGFPWSELMADVFGRYRSEP